MKNRFLQYIIGSMTGICIFLETGVLTEAMEVAPVVPVGGVNVFVAETDELLKSDDKTSHTLPKEEAVSMETVVTKQANAQTDVENIYENILIAQVSKYVNIRDKASEEGEVVGKLYNHSAGTLLREENGWFLMQSGSVTGYVKKEFCVTGEEAVELAKEVGTRIANVETTTLRVRKEPEMDAPTLGLIPMGEELLVLEELEDWVKVDTEEGDGYVSLEYVSLKTEFVLAESKEEEKARLLKEEKERALAREAAAREAAKEVEKNEDIQTENSIENGQTVEDTSTSEDLGIQVVEYALQFVGNPYKYGGTSLTNGIDCSGFTMKIYENFGVSLPHSSAAYRNLGATVDSLADAKSGDIIVYSGHVAIYMGNNEIVHASNKKDGIKVSNADYKKILSIRRIF